MKILFFCFLIVTVLMVISCAKVSGEADRYAEELFAKKCSDELLRSEEANAVRIQVVDEDGPATGLEEMSVTEEILHKTAQRDYSLEYQLLDRLRTDCEYFLGEGQRNEKYLWAGNQYAQIAKMRELYKAVPDKPAWLTPEMINGYEKQMSVTEQVRQEKEN